MNALRTFATVLLAMGIALLMGCSSAPKKATSSAGPAPAYPACTADAHCGAHGQVCVNGSCAQCRDASQCGAMGACGRCENNMCVKTEGCCATDGDCTAGGRCRAGKCK
jgi:peptidoglycan-associated lipoprotein